MFTEHFEKNFRYTDKELLIVARKLGKLATYCKRIKDEGSWIRVEAEKRITKKNADQMKVTITIKLPKKQFRAESRRRYIIDALDRCMEKLQPQLERYKELNSGKGRTQKKDRRNKALKNVRKKLGL